MSSPASAVNPRRPRTTFDTRSEPPVDQARNLLAKIQNSHADVAQAVSWLRTRWGVDAGQLAFTAKMELKKRGRHLPWQQMHRYLRAVVLGEFLARWKQKFAGRSWEQVEKEVSKADRQALELGIMAVADWRGFRRTLPKMVRQKQAELLGIRHGDDNDFEGFVAERTIHLSKRFFEQFNASGTKASRKAVRFLQVVATRLYLDKRTRPVRDGMPDFLTYIEHSTRLSPRTKLAVKLAYFPFLLTGEEADILAKEYGWKNCNDYRPKIKEIAERLGYKNAAALSNRLYKVRQWCKSAARKDAP